MNPLPALRAPRTGTAALARPDRNRLARRCAAAQQSYYDFPATVFAARWLGLMPKSSAASAEAGAMCVGAMHLPALAPRPRDGPMRRVRAPFFWPFHARPRWTPDAELPGP